MSVDDVKGLCPVVHCGGDESPIKSCEFAIVRYGKSQKIAVGDLRGCYKPRYVNPVGVQQGYVVRPEGMPGDFLQLQNRRRYGRRRTWRGITSVTQNAQCAIFSQRAGSPGTACGLRKPVMSPVVVDMYRVDQGDQNIYIEQKSHQGSSSRS